jgi:hypothetical protein
VRCRWLVLLLALCAGNAAGQSDKWPHGYASDMRLPPPTHESLEVRVWIEHDLSVPNYLFRFVKSGNQVTGDKLLYGGAALVEAVARRRPGSADWALCSPWRGGETPDTVVWCRVVTVLDEKWATAFRSLPIDRLWRLRERPPACLVLHGGGVGVELITESKRMQRWYWYPDTCCPSPDCRTVLDVLKLIKSLE